MDERTKVFEDKLAVIPKGAKPVTPMSRVYDFEHLGLTLADSLSTAADELVSNAQRLADDFRRLAAEIRAQVNEQSKALVDINTRMKAAGDQVLEAHKRFTGM